MAEGFYDFTPGQVLTAAQVDDYLMRQAVMRFADATARTTALSGVLVEGMMSYLKDTNTVEVYDGSAWVGVGGIDIANFTDTATGTYSSGGKSYKYITYTSSGTITFDTAGFADVLVVGGGAGGGDGRGGGGGAGGYIEHQVYIPAATYTITIGAGGAVSGGIGNDGNATVFGPHYGRGGGGGGSNGSAGRAGGSGGGGSVSAAGGAGTGTQGNAGGTSNGTANGAGGGGAGAVGESTGGGDGGAGLTSTIDNVSTGRAGGGAGGGDSAAGTATDGGGNGATVLGTAGSGTANTGGGGGGCGAPSGTAGAGGSGIVIVRVEV